MMERMVAWFRKNGVRFSLVAATVLSSSAYAGTGAWTSGGPYGGWVNAVAIDPTTPTTLYVGTAGGVTDSGRTFGVLKSTDSGGTWVAANTGLSIRSVYVLTIDPTSSSTLYAGTDDGLFRSVDSGGTWTEASTGLTNRVIWAVVVDPTKRRSQWR
jgi:hypothetical protein